MTIHSMGFAVVVAIAVVVLVRYGGARLNAATAAGLARCSELLESARVFGRGATAVAHVVFMGAFFPYPRDAEPASGEVGSNLEAEAACGSRSKRTRAKWSPAWASTSTFRAAVHRVTLVLLAAVVGAVAVIADLILLVLTYPELSSRKTIEALPEAGLMVAIGAAGSFFVWFGIAFDQARFTVGRFMEGKQMGVLAAVMLLLSLAVVADAAVIRHLIDAGQTSGSSIQAIRAAVAPHKLFVGMGIAVLVFCTGGVSMVAWKELVGMAAATIVLASAWLLRVATLAGTAMIVIVPLTLLQFTGLMLHLSRSFQIETEAPPSSDFETNNTRDEFRLFPRSPRSTDGRKPQ